MAASDDVAHLMRRAGFGATASEVAAMSAMSIPQIVAQLVDDVVTPPDTNPPAFFSDPNFQEWEYDYKLQQWWLDRMATSPKPLQEKLTLFWHGHLCSQNSKVGDAKLMYDQNKLFRDAGMGNFRSLIHTMSIQPAMLHYLDNAYNTAGDANENFARELMELFTLGVNQYSQADVAAAARAWTGYNVDDNDRKQFVFYPNRHDTGPEVFMGQSRSWTGPGIIDFLLTENTGTKMVAAKFIVKKLWTFFAYPSPAQNIIDELAQVFYNNDLEMKPLLTALFNRAEFYSNAAKQGLVRSPTEWIASIMKYTGYQATELNPQWSMPDMGQQLFEPPNVAGWKSNQYWLNASALWERCDFVANSVINHMFNWNNDPNVNTTIRDTLNTIIGSNSPNRFVDAVDYALVSFGIFNVSPNTRRCLVAAVTRQWHNGWDQRAWANLVMLVVLSPEFNLS